MKTIKKQKYSNKTKKEAKELLLIHFRNLNINLMQILEIKPKDYEKIIYSVADRDLLLLEKLGL